MAERTAPIHLAGACLEQHRHVCAFFHGLDEEFRVLMPFIQDGIQQGQKAFHITDPHLRHEHAQRLADGGIEVRGAEDRGQLEVRVWEDAYLRPGYFDQQAMLALIQELLRRGKEQGYPLTRLIANMEWALLDKPGVDDIVEYEARLNYVLPQYDDVVICTYDLSQFSADVVID